MFSKEDAAFWTDAFNKEKRSAIIYEIFTINPKKRNNNWVYSITDKPNKIRENAHPDKVKEELGSNLRRSICKNNGKLNSFSKAKIYSSSHL